MTDTNFPLSNDEDLPRTFRRARREREAAQQASALAHDEMAAISPAHDTASSVPLALQDAPPATVSAIDIPFFKLMIFFVKAVFAAIPALIILGFLVWLSGEILTAYFPQLLKMKILIQFPN